MHFYVNKRIFYDFSLENKGFTSRFQVGKLSNILDRRQYEINSHLIFSEEFYNRFLSGKEEELHKKMKFRIMSVRVLGEINFLHQTNLSNKESILKHGLMVSRSSERDTLGKGVYVYEINEYIAQNKYLSNVQRINITGKCKTEYLKCVYSPYNAGADGRLGEGSREYAILKDILPDTLSIVDL